MRPRLAAASSVALLALATPSAGGAEVAVPTFAIGAGDWFSDSLTSSFKVAWERHPRRVPSERADEVHAPTVCPDHARGIVNTLVYRRGILNRNSGIRRIHTRWVEHGTDSKLNSHSPLSPFRCEQWNRKRYHFCSNNLISPTRSC